MSDVLPDYERWKEANAGRQFSLFDYAHAILREYSVPPHVVLDVAKLIGLRAKAWNHIRMPATMDGIPFLSDMYWDEAYDQGRDIVRKGMSEVRVPDDLVPSVAGLVYPRFLHVDGRVYLAEQYSEEKVASLRAQGLDDNQVEFWINIFSVDGFCTDTGLWSESQEESFAQILASTWHLKLKLNFPQLRCTTKVVRDIDVGDLCVVLRQEYPG